MMEGFGLLGWLVISFVVLLLFFFAYAIALRFPDIFP